MTDTFWHFERKARNDDMDMTPMIDVVFLLLIFFMLTSTFMREESMELTLPQAGSATQTPASPVVITVTAEGTLTFDGQVTTLDELAARARELFSTDREAVVLVQADARGQVQRVVHVMDQLRQAGGHRILLGTQPDAGDGGAGASTSSGGMP